MTRKITKLWILLYAITCGSLIPTWAEAITFKRIVVFGASLSDPGNDFALTGQAISAPYSSLDDFLIPPAPYNIGGHHFSNGPTWIEQLARQIHMADSVEPAFAQSEDDALNYAVGGARARDDGINVDLSAQVAAFLNDVGSVAPSDALYVIDMGANDVRDALIAGSLPAAQSVLTDALTSIGYQMGNLYASGARKFLILNVPNLGVLPSIQILDGIVPGAAGFAQVLAQVFNTNLDSVIASIAALPRVEIARLDLYEKVDDIIAHPATYGLTEVTDACITPDVRPFTCRKPDHYLFWDGIHPTKAVHGILAQEAATVLEVKSGHSSFANVALEKNR